MAQEATPDPTDDSEGGGDGDEPMAEWDDEQWADRYGRTQGHTNALVLDDGTRLENHETVLRNEHGETQTFEVIGLRYEDFRWFAWGPHNVTVELSKSSIQSMFDAGDLEVVEE